MKKIRFTKDVSRHLESNEMIVVYEGDFMDGSPMLQAWDNEGPYATVTQFLEEHITGNGCVNINHDVYSINPFDGFLDAFLAEFSKSSKEIVFGPYRTRTLQIHLKDDWRDKIVEV